VDLFNSLREKQLGCGSVHELGFRGQKTFNAREVVTALERISLTPNAEFVCLMAPPVAAEHALALLRMVPPPRVIHASASAGPDSSEFSSSGRSFLAGCAASVIQPRMSNDREGTQR
jgi:hypothetical protein